MKRPSGRQVVLFLCTTVPCCALLGILIFLSRNGPPILGTGYVLQQDLAAGEVIQPQDVATKSLTYGQSDFGYLETSPVGDVASHPLNDGDLLTADDLLPVTAGIAQVAVTVSDAPALAAGETIDIYAQNAVSLVEVGAHIAVVGTSPLTIQVPAKDAPAWLALSADHLSLVALVTTDTASHGGTQIDVCQAYEQLSGSACPAGTGSALAPTPATSPSATPTSSPTATGSPTATATATPKPSGSAT
jgi:hypothetical protein